jgi:hypothetical protein
MRGQTSSAFFLMFREVLVVEFAVAGRAYFYTGDLRKRLEQAMWQEMSFEPRELRNVAGAHESISHLNGWENHVANTLARFGIRPQS